MCGRCYLLEREASLHEKQVEKAERLRQEAQKMLLDLRNDQDGEPPVATDSAWLLECRHYLYLVAILSIPKPTESRPDLRFMPVSVLCYHPVVCRVHGVSGSVDQVARDLARRGQGEDGGGQAGGGGREGEAQDHQDEARVR